MTSWRRREPQHTAIYRDQSSSATPSFRRRRCSLKGLWRSVVLSRLLLLVPSSQPSSRQQTSNTPTTSATLISRLHDRRGGHVDRSSDRRPRTPDMTSRGPRVVDTIDVFKIISRPNDRPHASRLSQSMIQNKLRKIDMWNDLPEFLGSCYSST